MTNKRLAWAIHGILRERSGVPIKWESITDILKIRRLAHAHQVQCCNSCNGEGYIPHKGRFSTAIEVGKDGSAYLSSKFAPDFTIFDLEITALELKIDSIASRNGYKAKYQRDPRGLTVSLFYVQREISEVLYI